MKTLLLLCLLLGLLLSPNVAATDVEDSQEDFDSAADTEVVEEADPPPPTEEHDEPAVRGIVARVHFEGKDVNELREYHAGEDIATVVGINNDVRNPTYEVVIIAAHVTRAGEYLTPIQNFTATRHSRYVAGGNTASFRYVFTPGELLDPALYNLAIRLYFKATDGNSFVVTAFNDTIVILEPLGFDSQQLFSYVLLLSMVVGATLSFPQVRRWVSRARRGGKKTGGQASTSVVKTETYDATYVSNEHLRFREQILQRASGSPKQSSPKRASATK